MKQLSQKKAYIILTLIILSALMLYTYFFFAKKKGYDSDEIWSYALSNSYYDPFLYTSNDWDGIYNLTNLKNTDVWLSGKIFHDYITVQKDQRFSYDSVWYNQAQDVHPPFYYAVLHTICSFFPDVYSPWFALSINYISFILVIFLLFKICNKWGNSTFALIVCAFYAYSGGATDTYTFLRMYALCALWATLLFYFLYNYLLAPSIKKILPLAITTLFASLTHYHLILFAFFFTLTTEIYFLIKKKWKNFFQLGLSMLFSVLGAFCIFPASITHLFHRGSDFSSQKMSLYCQFKYIINLIIWPFTGISFNVYHTMFPLYAGTVILLLMITLSVLFFLFRKEHLANRFFKRVKSLIYLAIQAARKIHREFPPHYNILPISLFFLYIFFAFNLPIASMKINSIRYLFPFYPILLIAVLILLKNIWKIMIPKANHKLSISLFFILLFTCTSNLFTVHPLLYDSYVTEGTSINELENESYCILLYENSYNLTNFSTTLQTKENIYALCGKTNEQNALPTTLSKLPSATNAPVYLLYSIPETSNVVILSSRSKEEWLKLICELPYVTQCTQVGTDCVNGYYVEIYRLR